MMYIGTDGVYTYTFEHEKRPECPVCGGEAMDVHVGADWTLERLIEWLVEKQDMCVHSLLFSVFVLTSNFQTDQKALTVCRK